MPSGCEDEKECCRGILATLACLAVIGLCYWTLPREQTSNNSSNVTAVPHEAINATLSSALLHVVNSTADVTQRIVNVLAPVVTTASTAMFVAARWFLKREPQATETLLANHR